MKNKKQFAAIMVSPGDDSARITIEPTARSMVSNVSRWGSFATFEVGGVVFSCTLGALERIRNSHVVPTPAFDMPCRWIFHTVGPVWMAEDSELDPPMDALLEGTRRRSALAHCYANAIKMAVSMGLTSIAFPAISTGVFGCPQKTCAYLAVTVSIMAIDAAYREKNYLGSGPGSSTGLEVTFYIHPKENVEIWEKALQRYMETK